MKIKSFNNIYFSLFWKIDLSQYPTQKEENLELAATVVANVLSTWYLLSYDFIDTLRYMDSDTLVNFYHDVLEIIQDNYANKSQLVNDSDVFYPGFPEEVMEKTDADLFAHQFLHYLTLWKYKPSDFEKKLPRKLVYAGENIEKILRPWSEEDFHSLMQQMMQSSVAFSPFQLRNIRTYLEEADKKHKKLPAIETLTNHENKIHLFVLAIEAEIEDINPADFFETATDVLRYVALISSRDENWLFTTNKISLRTWVDKHKFSRKERRLIMKLLDVTNDNIWNDMLRHEREWKFVANLIHPYDLAKFSNWIALEYKHAIDWFNILLWNEKWKPSIAKMFEEKMENKDMKGLIILGNKFPWDFCVRLDQILCLLDKNEKDISNVLSVIKDNTAKISTPLLLRVLWHLRARKEDIINNVYNPKWKIFITDKTQKALPEKRCDEVIETCVSAIAEKSANKEAMGNVYISWSMSDYRVPTDLREINDSVRPLTFGSLVEASTTWNIRRFFIWWTNNEVKHVKNETSHFNNYDYFVDNWRIDNDLWCLFLDKEYKPVWATGWNTRYRANDWAFVFSGDITDWWNIDWNWVSEYIDCDIEKLKERGIKYIVPNVTVYTWQKFCEQTHAMFWIMERDGLDLGGIYEPQSEKQRFDLISDSTQVVPMAFDVDENKIIWIDRCMPSSMKINIQWSQLDTLTETWALVKRAVESQIATLTDLILANVRTRWNIVDNCKEANIIFCTEDEAIEINEDLKDSDKEIQFVFPTDLTYFTGDLMAE